MAVRLALLLGIVAVLLISGCISGYTSFNDKSDEYFNAWTDCEYSLMSCEGLLVEWEYHHADCMEEYYVSPSYDECMEDIWDYYRDENRD